MGLRPVSGSEDFPQNEDLSVPPPKKTEILSFKSADFGAFCTYPTGGPEASELNPS